MSLHALSPKVDASDTLSIESSAAAARAAQERGDLQDALALWQQLRLRFPGDTRGYVGSGILLREFGRFDEADAVLAQGLQAFPADEEIAVARAWVAHARADWPEADRRWSAVRASFPACYDGYFGGAATLRALRRLDESDQLHRSALMLFPVSAAMLADFAATAQVRGDTEEAARRWTTVHTLFPAQVDSLLRQVSALRDAGLHAEADRLVTSTLERFPGHSDALVHSAQIAQELGRWDQALGRWEAVVAANPEAIEGYLGAARSLNELERFADAQNLLLSAIQKFPESSAAAEMSAWTEHYQQRYAEASIRWQHFRERFPEEPAGYLGGAAALLAQDENSGASQILEAARRRFPHDLRVAMDWARVSERIEDWTEAVRRWTQVFDQFPGNPEVRAEHERSLSTFQTKTPAAIIPDTAQPSGGAASHVAAALALRELGRLEDAEAFLAAAVAQFPAHLELLLEWASVAAERSDWSQASERYRRVAASHDSARAVVGLADALFHERRYVEADEILARAASRYPEDREVQRMFAACASQNDRQQQALQRWQAAQQRFPEDVSFTAGLIRALTDIGRFDDAQELLGESLRSHATDRGLLEAQANLATRTGAWADAVRMWQALSSAYPQDVNLRNSLMGAQFAANFAALGGSGDARESMLGATGPLAAAQVPRSHRMADIVWAFESLGDNCDFGLLQRYFGAEPLGLLRWAGTFPDEIIAAAKGRFDGVGEPEHTVIEVWPNGEYCVTDKRYSMLTHTFTYESVVDRDSFFQQQVRRGRFLKRKLIEDIETDQKLLVYKSSTITKAQAHELKAALRQIGPAWLLVVLVSENVDDVGTVEQVEEGLLFGYIDAFPNLQEPPSDPIVATWSLICERAFDLWTKSHAGLHAHRDTNR